MQFSELLSIKLIELGSIYIAPSVGIFDLMDFSIGINIEESFSNFPHFFNPCNVSDWSRQRLQKAGENNERVFFNHTVNGMTLINYNSQMMQILYIYKIIQILRTETKIILLKQS